MLRVSFLFVFLAAFAACKNSEKKSTETPTATETELKQDSTVCVFNNPDTSLSGIILRDSETSAKVLRVKELLGDTSYYFSSTDRKQVLEVHVYPGDGISQVSYFKVGSTVPSGAKAASSSIAEFISEKGIRLGIAREELIPLLGNCFTTKDSSANAITISYRLEQPADSKTGFMKRQNMPVYYADYRFVDNKLSEFEFGFEYP